MFRFTLAVYTIQLRKKKLEYRPNLFLVLFLNPTSAEPGYALPFEANWSGCAPFVIKYANLFQ